MRWHDLVGVVVFFVAIFLFMVVVNCWFLTALRTNSGIVTDGTCGCVTWTLNEYKGWVFGVDTD